MNMEELPPKRRTTPYVDFKNSRLFFGVKFWTAVALAAFSVIAYAIADTDKPEGRVTLGLVAIAGVVIGVLLQPSPKPQDHGPRARQALQNVATGIELIRDVQSIASDIPSTDPTNLRLGVGIASINTDLTRARKHFTSSMAEWDEVAPGAVSDFRKSQRRGLEILAELALEEGHADE